MQLCVRALVLFIFGIVCIRIAGRRTVAQYSPLDIIVAPIVGSNTSRVMTGKAAFFPALFATLVLVLFHRLLAMASFCWGWLSTLVKARPIRLIVGGRTDPRAMRRANLTEQDLHEAVRMKQVSEPSEVELATIEGGGKVSVVPKRRK